MVVGAGKSVSGAAAVLLTGAGTAASDVGTSVLTGAGKTVSGAGAVLLTGAGTAASDVGTSVLAGAGRSAFVPVCAIAGQ